MHMATKVAARTGANEIQCKKVMYEWMGRLQFSFRRCLEQSASVNHHPLLLRNTDQPSITWCEDLSKITSDQFLLARGPQSQFSLFWGWWPARWELRENCVKRQYFNYNLYQMWIYVLIPELNQNFEFNNVGVFLSDLNIQLNGSVFMMCDKSYTVLFF